MRTARNFALIGALVAIPAILLVACHGHVLKVENVPNHAQAFDFSRPPCNPAPPPSVEPDELRLHYSGVSGIYLEYRGHAVMGAPFFSRRPLHSAAFGTYREDRAGIDRAMREIPADRVRALLVGHSHYDHIGDVPSLLDRHLPGARAWVNRTGSLMLQGYEGSRDRVQVIDDLSGTWIPLGGGDDAPVRIMPVPSPHAPAFAGYDYAKGEVTEPWTETFEGHDLRKFKSGRTFSFVIDFLSDNRASTLFRVLYLDAAGIPEGLPLERPYDLVILCVPSFWQVDGYPEELMAAVGARFVLLTHYEDFFRALDKPIRFAPRVTDKRANRLVERVRMAMVSAPLPLEPRECTCGPCGRGFGMPLPGEWMAFPIGDSEARSSRLGEGA